METTKTYRDNGKENGNYYLAPPVLESATYRFRTAPGTICEM